MGHICPEDSFYMDPSDLHFKLFKKFMIDKNYIKFSVQCSQIAFYWETVVLFYFWPHCRACSILVPLPGIELMSSFVEVLHLNL